MALPAALIIERDYPPEYPGAHPVRLNYSVVAGTLTLALALRAGSVAAQEVPVTPGSRARVTVPSLVAPLVANFLEQRGDTLVFIEEGSGPGVWSFALAQIDKLEVTGGQARRNRNFVAKGAAWGAAGGLVLGIMFAAAARPSEEGRTYNRPVTGLVGAALGGGIGAFVGSRREIERWVTVPLPGRLALAPNRSGLGLSVRIR
jgi:hypothetical protein